MNDIDTICNMIYDYFKSTPSQQLKTLNNGLFRIDVKKILSADTYNYLRKVVNNIGSISRLRKTKTFKNEIGDKLPSGIKRVKKENTVDDEIEINTSELSIDESVQKVLDYVLPIIKNK